VLLRFDGFVFDPDRRQLTRHGRPVHLSPKAFDLLGTLLAQRPRAVARDALLGALWPDTFVGKTSVAQLVNEVRGALGDDPRQPRFVRTVQRFGYAWMGAAEASGPEEAAAPRSRCLLMWGRSEIPLQEGENLVGRAPESLVRIPSAKVSRRHARIVVAGTRADLEDLRSRNGTFIGKRRVEAPTTLTDGDEIVIGPAVLVFVSGPTPAGPTEDDSH
jgi:DNA-binding winged helix-turn-helix (wHTH) protein